MELLISKSSIDSLKLGGLLARMNQEILKLVNTQVRQRKLVS